MVVADFIPNVIKPHLELFMKIANGVASMLPGAVGTTVRSVLSLLSSVITEDWFLELVCYLLNSFAKKEVTTQELSDALKHYATQIKVVGAQPPLVYVGA